MSETQLPETAASSTTDTESTSSQPPITRKHIVGVASLALTLCIIIITPGIIADYNTAQFLKPPAPAKKHRNSSRWADLVRRSGVVLNLKGKYGKSIRGWLFRPTRPHSRLVIFLHDFGQDRRYGYELVRDLVGHGLNVLAYDLRAHGESDGKVGRNYRLHSDDHRAILHYLKRLLPNQWIYPVATIGVGVGGSAALLSATLDGTFRYVIAIDPPLDPATEIKKRFGSMGSLLLDLTKKRITRVGDIHYRRASPLKSAHRLRDTKIRIYTTQKPENVRKYSTFCAKTKGFCKLKFLKNTTPGKWWLAMKRYQRDSLVQFLLQKFNIPRSKYRLALRPVPPPPKRRAKPRKKPKARNAKPNARKTKGRKTKPTKRKRIWRNMPRRRIRRAVPKRVQPKGIKPRVRKAVKVKVRKPAKQVAVKRAPVRRVVKRVPPQRRKPLARAKLGKAGTPVLRQIPSKIRPTLRVLQRKVPVRTAAPAPRAVLIQPKKRPSPSKKPPTSRKAK